jgi:signal transduction histidine kinase
MARLQQTLLAPVVLLLVAFGSALAFVVHEGSAQTRALRARVDRVERASALILRLNQLERETMVNVFRYAADRSPDALVELSRADPETTRTVVALREVDPSPGGRRLLTQYIAARNVRRAARGELVDAAAVQDAPRVRLASRRWELSRVRAEAHLADVSAYNLNLLKRTLTELDRRRSASSLLLALTFGVSLVVVLAYGWWVARRVVGPVGALTRAAASLPQGPFVPPPAALNRNDEIGVLARTFARVTEEMRRANARMTEAVRARDEFLSVASHELRTPLTPLKLHLQSAPARAATAAGDAPRWLAVSLRQVGRLEKLVNELLDVTRIRAGRVVLAPEATDLARVVEGVVERLSPELRQGGHDVQLALQPAVGSWDPSRVDQIVTNLVGNVIRHAPGAALRIAVERRGGRVALRIRDTGPGIPDEIQDRLFACFEQGSSARAVGGLGLGLFISRTLAEAHGGSLRIAGGGGPGTELVLELPLGEAANETGARPAGQAPA